MKATFYRVESPPQESFRCVRVPELNFNTGWHFHPEYQITRVVRSCGQRLVGDNISPFEPRDLTLIGPNLPHFWRHDEGHPDGPGDIEAIIIQFGKGFMGAEFFDRPELRSISAMLDRAARGVHFTNGLPDDLDARMRRILELSGLDRVLELLKILDDLASAQMAPISSPGFLPDLSRIDQERFSRVCEFIYAHLDQPLSRDRLARLVGLCPRSFSRYFRFTTGKTLPGFVNELRIGRACRLLLESDLTISEIALRCGFSNFSNFSEHFRRLKGLAPTEFRRSAADAAIWPTMGDYCPPTRKPA